MTIEQAARTLREMYEHGKARHEAKTHVHLFGVRHADELDGLSLKEVAIRAGLPESYQTEIYNGVKLARYVQERS